MLRIKTAFLLLLIALGSVAIAQPQLPEGLQRLQLGYSLPLTKATYTVRNYFFDESFQQNAVDTSFSKEISTVGGFGFTIGTYFPIVKLSEKAVLAISLDYLYNFMLWDGTTQSLTGYSDSLSAFTYDYDFPINGITGHMGLPFGVDFKYGGDATLDKSNKLSMSFGTGIYPSLNATVFDFSSGVQYKVKPYLKGEIGFHAGITFKVRALYSFGKIDYLSYSSTLGGDLFSQINGTSLTSKSQLTLSLLVMPFSWAWQRKEWW